MELLIVVAAVVLVYFAIVKFSGLTETNIEKIGANQAKDLVNQYLGRDWCIRASISSFTPLFDEDNGSQGGGHILTAYVKMKGIKKDYCCLIDDDGIEHINKGARYLAKLIKNEVAQQEITC